MQKELKKVFYLLRFCNLTPPEVCEVFGHKIYQGRPLLFRRFLKDTVKAYGRMHRCQRCKETCINPNDP